MFKRKVIFSIFFLLTSYVFCQELVSNGSFERKKNYPYSYGQMDLVYDWQGGSTGKWAMPNYFYERTYDCPKSIGKQTPHTGKAYTGVGFALRKKRYKGSQYIQTKLRFPMEKDSLYIITAYVSFADKFQTATDYLPAAFSEKSMLPYNLNPAQINRIQMRFEQPYLDSTKSWMKITARYKATGEEQFFMIGGVEEGKIDTAFSLKKMPFKLRLAYIMSKNITYYFIDDVSIRKEGWGPIMPVQLKEPEADEFEHKKKQ